MEAAGPNDAEAREVEGEEGHFGDDVGGGDVIANVSSRRREKDSSGENSMRSTGSL